MKKSRGGKISKKSAKKEVKIQKKPVAKIVEIPEVVELDNARLEIAQNVWDEWNNAQSISSPFKIIVVDSDDWESDADIYHKLFFYEGGDDGVLDSDFLITFKTNSTDVLAVWNEFDTKEEE